MKFGTKGYKTILKLPAFIRGPSNPLLRLLYINGLIGVGISGLLLGGIFFSNIGNLRTLVMNADDPVLPVVMLAFALVITIGSVVMGTAVMMLRDDSKDISGGGGTRNHIDSLPFGSQPALVPARIRQ
ncbi:conserved hypothetical protein [Roseibium sp. TrichSKD4]|uniref:hypothetical protein n=1 Tax=Roseibium sp. TrichSKD4 TaxID=744980 RepID=UPI0001E5710D|nr:hypothetical protein [Roseibium sp. TrichSKD4]EFO29591.1 conserved hypothetical protein [Roseibium sp. TrichSKD4]